MTSSVFLLRLDGADRYLLRRLALERGLSANALVTALVCQEVDKALPGAREAYERRAEVPEQVLRRRGIDPASADYIAAQREARTVLETVDGLCRDRPV